ncbi:NYN domain-containing protein [Patescibacteria group bacterium]|nr:NYN domain-containing protein [Patescibacteria group bacterium]MCG2694859.1 NYN domain-containing protein [Candidatus Parcubacteria bacterium]
MNKNQILKLKGRTMVFIDYANVYGWRKNLKKEINLKSLFEYLTGYNEILEINFYYGKDNNGKSEEFLKDIQKIGYHINTKPVKHIKIEGTDICQRKCDFDLEIGLDCFEELDSFDGFVFFTGDGDFATLYERLIKKGKQIIVIYTKGHLGKEVWLMKKGIFKTEFRKLSI